MSFAIFHCLTLRPPVDTIFYSSIATMHIYSHTKFELSFFITSWRMRGPKNPRLRRGVVKAPPSGENFQHSPKHIDSRKTTTSTSWPTNSRLLIFKPSAKRVSCLTKHLCLPISRSSLAQIQTFSGRPRVVTNPQWEGSGHTIMWFKINTPLKFPILVTECWARS